VVLAGGTLVIIILVVVALVLLGVATLLGAGGRSTSQALSPPVIRVSGPAPIVGGRPVVAFDRED
jgi:hypothetical protein